MLTKGSSIETRQDRNLKLNKTREFKTTKLKELAKSIENSWDMWNESDGVDYENLLRDILDLAESIIDYEITWFKTNMWSVTSNDIFSYVQEKVWLGFIGEQHFIKLKEGFLVYESVKQYIKGLIRNYKTKIKGEKVKHDYWHYNVDSIEGFTDDRTMSKPIKASQVISVIMSDYSNKEDISTMEYITKLCEGLIEELTSVQKEVLEIMLVNPLISNVEIGLKLSKSEGSIRKTKDIIQRKGKEYYKKVRIAQQT